MRVPDYSRRILALAQLLHRWAGQLMSLDAARRDKVARYAEEIAGTLARAAEGQHKLEAEPANGVAQRALVRELGRISGYLETIVGVLHRLNHHLNHSVFALRAISSLYSPQSAGLAE